jgi:hypothetical protein
MPMGSFERSLDIQHSPVERQLSYAPTPLPLRALPLARLPLILPFCMNGPTGSPFNIRLQDGSINRS